jgi:hypothetical protein
MDWDLFIRLGKRYPIDYVSKDIANLREYASAKTLSGGRRRLAELLAVMRRHGARRYPPAWLAYATDTYFRLAFGALRRGLPARLEPALRRLEHTLERPVYGTVNRLAREAQGLYADGWAAGTAHFLIPNPRGATDLVLRGALPIAPRSRRPASVAAIAGGRPLGPRRIDTPGDFELAWTVPQDLRAPEALDVQLRTRPTFRPSRLPLTGDRRRLGFRLKSLSID